MAEEDNKKPKIDLRARLGKKTVAGGNPSIPPPMTTGGGIPAPPFASKAPVQPEQPKFVQPQAIKIEMSEEVVQAQKKGKTKVIMVAAGMAVVGAVIGVAVGGGMERRKRQDIAVEGAKLLSKDIDEANAQINKLAEVLGEAKRALSDGEFPEQSVSKLADISVPFDATYLAGKGTGLMSPKLNMQLVDFAGKAAAANEQKDTLHRVLTASMEPIKELLSQADKPKFNWSIYVGNGPHGPIASMQPLPVPFLVSSKEKMKDKDGKEVDYAWPEEFEIAVSADKKEKLARYKEGSPIAQSPLLIPVDPASQASVCPSDTMMRLRGEIVKLEELLKGDISDPSNEKKGLEDLGKELMDELKSIGGA